MKTIEGLLNGEQMKVAIVAARFNDWIVSRLVDGAKDGLRRNGVDLDQVDIYYVPGAFEIPLVTKKVVATGNYDGVICLGAVIRGETPHFDYVCAEVSKGIATVSMDYETPVMFGILTTDTVDQAADRAGAKSGNKGFEAALGLIEMVRLMENIA